MPYEGTNIRMSASEMVCPRTRKFYALMFNYTDTQAMQVFPDHANQDIQLQRKWNILICDNASWHKSKSLDWERFEPVFLPPYSPDLNPIECLWFIMRAE